MAIVEILLLICMLAILFLFYISWRNELVYKYRIRIVNEMAKDINSEEDFYKYDSLVKYSYNKMLWEIFKFKWEYKDGKIV